MLRHTLGGAWGGGSGRSGWCAKLLTCLALRNAPAAFGASDFRLMLLRRNGCTRWCTPCASIGTLPISLGTGILQCKPVFRLEQFRSADFGDKLSEC